MSVLSAAGKGTNAQHQLTSLLPSATVCKRQGRGGCAGEYQDLPLVEDGQELETKSMSTYKHIFWSSKGRARRPRAHLAAPAARDGQEPGCSCCALVLRCRNSKKR